MQKLSKFQRAKAPTKNGPGKHHSGLCSIFLLSLCTVYNVWVFFLHYFELMISENKNRSTGCILMLFHAYGYSLTVIFSMDKSVNAFGHIFEGLLLIELIKPLTSDFFGHLGAETSCE